MGELNKSAAVLRRTSAAEQIEAVVARGVALARDGRRQDAIPLFRRVLTLRPDETRVHYNLGVALAEEKNYTEALTSFQAAVHCQPDCSDAHYGLGNVLGELDRDEEAVAAYHQAIALQPDHAASLHNLGAALTRLRRGGEALVFLEQAVRLRPDCSDAHNSLGLAHREKGDYASAEASFKRALHLNPRNVDAHTNLGSVFKELGRLEEALACYTLALALDPGNATTHWNRSLAWLQMGNFQQGWTEYEWRWKRKRARPAPYAQPLWDGSPLRGRTILLHAEQGLGDMLQFVRFVPLVKELGGVVVVAAPLPVIEVLATCRGVDRTLTENQALPPFDVHAPFMSLPRLLGTTLATLPADVPYLAADPAKLERWRLRLRDVPGFKVGITWQGNPRHEWDRYRSFPLTLLEPIARIDGVTLVGLQKGSTSAQIGLIKARFPVIDLGAELADFSETAAIVKHLDLVICCDTSVAHLAGALAVPVWVALSTIVDWRWLRGRVDNPWYPTMRLFQQKRLGNWKPVFQRMARELVPFCEAHGTARPGPCLPLAPERVA
jgi:tetratricopeptide (TPR) repeat protein